MLSLTCCLGAVFIFQASAGSEEDDGGAGANVLGRAEVGRPGVTGHQHAGIRPKATGHARWAPHSHQSAHAGRLRGDIRRLCEWPCLILSTAV